jgi:hypothetical protein
MSGSSKANQRQGNRHKGRYDAYQAGDRRTKNKVRKLSRHLFKYEDKQAVAALKKILKDKPSYAKLIRAEVRTTYAI